jgi:hypothetical protein
MIKVNNIIGIGLLSATIVGSQSQMPTPFTKVRQGPIVTDKVNTLSGMWADYDRDGRLDLVVIGDYIGSGVNTRLYHNEGDGVFVQVTNAPWGGLRIQSGYGAWADLNNDGNLDLFLTTVSPKEAVLLMNQGQGAFNSITVNSNWLSNPIPIGFGAIAMADINQDGYLDVFAGNLATAYSGGWDSLLMNNRDGTFSAATNNVLYRQRIVNESAAGVDYDNDGDLDLFVTRYGGSVPSQLYRNNGSGVFEEVTPEPIRSLVKSGLGSSWADFDNDGDMDMYFGDAGNASGRFFLNNGDGTFTQWKGQPYANGVFPGGFGRWGDYDNDGHLDLFITSGFGGAGNRLFRNLGDGNFEQIRNTPMAMDSSADSQSAAWADIDDDGFLDLFVANSVDRSGNYLYHNNGNSNHWLEVKLVGTASNRDGVGARIRVRATIGGKTFWQMRQISAQPPAQELVAHFGLGDATNIDVVRIEWPSGIVQELHDVAPRQILTVTEPPRLEVLEAGRIRIQCWSGQGYEVEVSDDLKTWSSLGVVLTDHNRPVVIDAGAPGKPYRFYRAKGQ